MEEDEASRAAREISDKDLLLLGRLKAYRDRFELIRELAKNPARPSKLAALVRIYGIAEEALTL